MKITYKDISIVKFNYLEYKCSTMVNGYLFERKYYGFSKKKKKMYLRDFMKMLMNNLK